ncbi:MAG: ABC transporter ATP-binding protein, partial [Spirosomataceae bacterium]
MTPEAKSGKIFDGEVLRRLFSFITPYKLQFYFLIFLIVLSAILAPVLPLLIKYTIDNPIATGDYQELSVMLSIMIGTLILGAFISFFNTYLSGWLGQHIIRDIRIQLYDKLLQFRLKFFDNTPVGRLVTRTISDIETLSNVFSAGFAAIIGDILQLILIISVMFYTDWRLSLISLSTVPLMLVSTYVFKEKVKASFNLVRNAVSNLNSFVQEHITGMNVVQIFNAEEIEYQKFEKINAAHRDAN